MQDEKTVGDVAVTQTAIIAIVLTTVMSAMVFGFLMAMMQSIFGGGP